MTVRRTANDLCLDLLFREARSFDHWTDEALDADQLRAVWELTKMGPTTANSCPARIHFVVSDGAKERLVPLVSNENKAKVRGAPAVAIIGFDMEFYEHLPFLFPAADARAWFAGNAPLIEVSAFRNGTLQGAYFMLAARALGLDCGPMSGFDNDAVDAEFFAGTAIKSNFLCAVGFGIADALPPRSPRFAFDEACTIL